MNKTLKELSSKRNIFDTIEYVWYRIYSFIPETYREIKYAIQRAHRGYSDRDCWSIHNFLSDILPKMIRKLANSHSGCPHNLFDKKKKDNECHKWKSILIKMAEGFEASKSIDNLDYIQDDFPLTKRDEKAENKRRDNLYKKFYTGMKLFGKYFFGLWD